MAEQISFDNSDVMVERTANIVTAYVSNQAVPYDEVARLIADVHAALREISVSGGVGGTATRQKPAISVWKSLRDDRLTCLECGATLKTMRRHLATQHGLSPSAYRNKWNLPSDYPMVSPSYAEARSATAKAIGLGKKQSSQF
jgi:predicted transcriptional regulator